MPLTSSVLSKNCWPVIFPFRMVGLNKVGILGCILTRINLSIYWVKAQCEALVHEYSGRSNLDQILFC